MLAPTRKILNHQISMFKFARNTVIAIVGTKAAWDIGNTGYKVGSNGFKQRDPLTLSLTPVACGLAGIYSCITTSTLLVGSPIGVPMYTYNYFNNDKAKNERFHEFLNIPIDISVFACTPREKYAF